MPHLKSIALQSASLPERYPFSIPAVQGLTTLEFSARVVANVISRMTDDQALRMHQRLSGMQPGSLADLLA